MNTNLETALKYYNEYKLDESRFILEDLLQYDEKNEVILVTLGKIHSRTQNYGEAMNFFNNVLNLNKDNLEAKTGLQLIKNILQLTNNYYYENPYTDEDLYEF